MTIERRVLKDLSTTLRARLVRDTVIALEELPALLSPNYARLANTWEEICVQVQGEESVDWEIYLDIISDLLGGSVDTLSPAELTGIWLFTDVGDDWRLDFGDGEAPPVAGSDVVDELQSEVLRVAADAQSPSIERFLNSLEDEDDEDDEDEDEDKDEDEDEEDEDGDSDDDPRV